MSTSSDIVEKLHVVLAALDEAEERLAALKIAEAIKILETRDSSSTESGDHGFGNDN